MVYILIIHHASMLDSINDKNILSTKWKIQKLGVDEESQILISSIDNPPIYTSIQSDGGYNYVKRSGGCYVRLELTTKLDSNSFDFDYTEKEWLELTSLSDKIEYTFVKYSDLETLNEVLNLLSERLEFYIDNDFGTLLHNKEFMYLWNKNPSWDWSNDLKNTDSYG
jgi:hypothetical protein